MGDNVLSLGWNVDTLNVCKNDLEAFCVHRSKCTKIIKNVVSKHIEAKLAESVKDQKFAILIDEWYDVHVRPRLATCYIFQQ